ncbi:signal peptidase II [Candidatus Parcubacteria bacterium]|nr:signal peptidase II [Patescibacteria group bacterium]MCG2693950.1 signal peptidase II [Candidatus Parcubacteria bacterium]
MKFIISSINLGGGFIKFGLYKNYAGAFSLPVAGMVYNLIGIALLVIFMYLLMVSLRAKQSNFISLAYLFIILGGASNLFDRLFFGHVIDCVNVLNRSFFNIADGMIIIGVIILLIEQIKVKKDTIKV